MKPVKVTCDTGCDLSAQLYQRYAISAVPLSLEMQGRLFQDGVNVSPADVYSYVDKTGQLPSAAAPDSHQYRRFFRQYTDQGYQVVHISTSGALSGLYRNALAAADGSPDIFVVDSRSISTGAGQLVILGVELSHAGLSAAEIADALEHMKLRLRSSVLVSTPYYLRKSKVRGQFALAAAQLGRARPVVQMLQGRLAVSRRLAGDWDSALAVFLREQLGNRHNIQSDRLFLTHTGLSPDRIKKAISLIQSIQHFDDIVVTAAGCGSCCRSGPGSLGIHYLCTQ